MQVDRLVNCFFEDPRNNPGDPTDLPGAKDVLQAANNPAAKGEAGIGFAVINLTPRVPHAKHLLVHGVVLHDAAEVARDTQLAYVTRRWRTLIRRSGKLGRSWPYAAIGRAANVALFVYGQAAPTADQRAALTSCLAPAKLTLIPLH